MASVPQTSRVHPVEEHELSLRNSDLPSAHEDIVTIVGAQPSPPDPSVARTALTNAAANNIDEAPEPNNLSIKRRIRKILQLQMPKPGRMTLGSLRSLAGDPLPEPACAQPPTRLAAKRPKQGTNLCQQANRTTVLLLHCRQLLSFSTLTLSF